MARTIDGVVEIKHDADQTNHCIGTDTGRAQFGATEQNDLLCITNRNGRSTLCPHDNTGHVNLAGNRQDGDLLIENSKGKTTVRNIGKKFFTKTVVKHVNHTPNIWAAAVLAVATLIPLPSLADTPRTVQAWGGNGSGDLGIGVASFGEALPREVVNLNDVKAIAGGNLHSLAL
ncbi:MAG: hypothetical protein NPIRA02_04560 [Nitrospirales bacterium]|nr:MAG: hypothetical protein NPIRA02_04560 [Nitrospirales bacterium]